MEIGKFKEKLSRYDKDDLIKVLLNVRVKRNVPYEDMVLAELDSRFPGWHIVKRGKSGGRTYNRATVFGETKEFETAKDGFVWLITKFVSKDPSIFDSPNSKLVRVAVGRGRNYFARSPEKLFPKSPHLAENSSSYEKLPNGWYANVNMSNAEKFRILSLLAWATKLEFEKDWNWEVIGSTKALVDRIALEKWVNDIINSW